MADPLVGQSHDWHISKKYLIKTKLHTYIYLDNVLYNNWIIKYLFVSDYTVKSPSAVDFFDIDDVAEDAQVRNGHWGACCCD